MAKYTDAKCRQCRREGCKLFLKGERCTSGKCAIDRRPVVPGQHGAARKKVTEYGLQLREKQKVRRAYGMLERQFENLYEEAARRELFEETGYVPKKLVWLGSFYQDQGCSGAYNQAFLAEGCRKIGNQKLDKDEVIRYFKCSIDELFELVSMGKINDCQSQLAIERSKQYLKV